MEKMLSPRLRHRVTFQSQEMERNSEGETDLVWSDFLANEPAELVPVSGREYLTSATLKASVIARLTVRWRAGFDASMRILHDGQTYNISAILPDRTGRRWITMIIYSGVNDG